MKARKKTPKTRTDMAEKKNVRFLKKANLPLSNTQDWNDDWIGVFVHIGKGYWVEFSEEDVEQRKVLVISEDGSPNEITPDDNPYFVKPGLWFGGAQGWEMLSNTEGITEEEVEEIVIGLIDERMPVVEGEGCVTVKLRSNGSENPTYVVGLEWKNSLNSGDDDTEKNSNQDTGE